MTAWFRHACLVLAPVLALAAAEIRFDGMFTDHAVLQRDAPIRISGFAAPGQRVEVTLATSRADASAGADGAWTVELAALPAGGPHTLAAAVGADRVEIHDVLIGEVWFCSGQSNMAVVLGKFGGESEVARSECPTVRVFATWYGRRVSPAHEAEGAWVPSTPAVAGGFPAVPYFFARALQRELKIPVGVVVSAVGATSIHEWLDRESLAAEPSNADWLGDVGRARAAFGEAIDDRGFAAVGYDDSSWKQVAAPGAWEKAGLGMDRFDGVVWLRRTVPIPAGWRGSALALRLGAIDDRDVAYVDGVRVGAMGPETPDHWKVPRVYAVPAGTVTGGTATIAVRITDKLGDGGFVGPDAEMSIGPAGAADGASLAGSWRWRVVESFPQPGLPTALYNNLVAPWTRTTIRGILWYQGESDVRNPPRYRSSLRSLIRGWRADWALGDIPFLVVQLPEFGDAPEPSGRSAWADFREVQAAVAGAEPACGTVVTIGLGDPKDIHPPNKRDVGERAALQALARAYAKPVVSSGPVFSRMTEEPGRLRLQFTEIGGGLMVHGATLSGFSVAGSDGRYAAADAVIEGDCVLVSSPAVAAPVHVRYGWADSPACGLYNRDGLPAMPFRTDAAPR
jgi:sialate O-acetylesterase